jgi:hypothetical protein
MQACSIHPRRRCKYPACRFGAEARGQFTGPVPRASLHDQAAAEPRQHSLIEGFRSLIVGNRKTVVIRSSHLPDHAVVLMR